MEGPDRRARTVPWRTRRPRAVRIPGFDPAVTSSAMRDPLRGAVVWARTRNTRPSRLGITTLIGLLRSTPSHRFLMKSYQNCSDCISRPVESTTAVCAVIARQPSWVTAVGFAVGTVDVQISIELLY